MSRSRTAALFLLIGLPLISSGKQPNIIILLADDLGYGELSCQNPDTDVPTPHIDSIAEAGIRFSQAYVTAPNCSPSRAGLLTGKIPTRFGYEHNPIGWKNELPDHGLPLEETTLAELLHNHGYTTGLIGKWHLGEKPRSDAPYRWELYDLAQDHRERNDLATEQPEQLLKLKSEWSRMNREMREPLF